MKTKQSKGKCKCGHMENEHHMDIPNACRKCSCDFYVSSPPQDTQEAGREWEKEFSKKFTDNILENGYGNDLVTDQASDIMDFIRSLLRSEQKRWQADLRKRVEEMMRVDPTYRDDTENNIHNKALSDVLALIDAGKGKV